MSIGRHWSRNARESPDKEVNRRPTSLKKFRADALRGPRVSIETSWNIKSGGREEYLVSFLFEAVSAAVLAEWDVECRYESARVLITVTSHVWFAALPWYQCESVRPIAVEPGKADRLLGYGDACCGYGTGNDVIDGSSKQGAIAHFNTL